MQARELAEYGLTAGEQGPGWVRERSAGSPPAADVTQREWVFPHRIMLAPVERLGKSVNALAQQLVDDFAGGLRGERIDAPWPCVFAAADGMPGLNRRAAAVEEAFHHLLRKRLSRVAKLAGPELPRGSGTARGWFVFFVDFGRVLASRTAWLGGQRRMADDPLAPSRSYLKVEEAYGVLGREPQAGEVVVDLGAAPGGWSYSAAKRGARVVAVDNGPLKGGALNHPQIEHRREDAFRFHPARGELFDWLFCDLVEEPHHVLHDIVEPWLVGGWCRRWVINLKFGRVDPIALLRELRAPGFPLARPGTRWLSRHLYHDREEITLVGETKYS
ncbi:MAG: SAM-dependent methyltransferase [Opitutaceae bacterium]|nr:SAM-dependent methyltransferase [Opitutaceae bacterium]